MDVALSRDDRQAMDWLAVGKFALCLFCGNIEAARAQGLSVEEFETYRWKETPAISSGSNGSIALMNQAPHPNAAQLFINWLLSREGQVSFQKIMNSADLLVESMRVDIAKDAYSRAAATSRRNEIHHHGYAGTEQSRAGEQAFQRDHQEIAANLVGKIASTRKLICLLSSFPRTRNPERAFAIRPYLDSWIPGLRRGSPWMTGMRKPSDGSESNDYEQECGVVLLRFDCFCSWLLIKPFMPQAAWEAEWERTVKAAEQEGELSYYTVGEFNFLSEFEKKFPRVKVKVVQGRGNELLVRIMTERRAGKYLADVARIGNTSPYALYQAKTCSPSPARSFCRKSKTSRNGGRASINMSMPRANISSFRSAASR